MIVRDAELLKFWMDRKHVSHRQLATAAGWKWHSIVGRVLDGSLKSVPDDKAAAIARRLGLPTTDLFLSVPASKNGRANQENRRAA